MGAFLNPFKRDRALKIVDLRNKKLTWGQIGIKLKMDRNNTRRAYLKFNQSNSDNLAQQGAYAVNLADFPDF